MKTCAKCKAAIATDYEKPYEGRWYHAGCLERLLHVIRSVSLQGLERMKT